MQALKLRQWSVIGNVIVERVVAELEGDVKAGSTISKAMRRQAVFRAPLLRMNYGGNWLDKPSIPA